MLGDHVKSREYFLKKLEADEVYIPLAVSEKMNDLCLNLSIREYLDRDNSLVNEVALRDFKETSYPFIEFIGRHPSKDNLSVLMVFFFTETPWLTNVRISSGKCKCIYNAMQPKMAVIDGMKITRKEI